MYRIDIDSVVTSETVSSKPNYSSSNSLTFCKMLNLEEINVHSWESTPILKYLSPFSLSVTL